MPIAETLVPLAEGVKQRLDNARKRQLQAPLSREIRVGL